MFKNKVVIVTGGAQGIGRTIAEKYAEQEAIVVVADLQEPADTTMHFIRTDVKSEQDIQALMAQVVERFGAIDILINNAGKFVVTPPTELSLEVWDDVINTNLRSAFLCAREASKYMKGGAIVSMASTRAFQSELCTEAYAASKGGIIALTHALAASFAKQRITVNCISPGWIETQNYEALRAIDHEQHLSRRVGKPEDIAQACLYLTNPENNFITGTNIIIDGGMTKKMLYEE
ncbi:SDR family oxidoreductase [Lysinibacillus sp. LZ02]|uniref:SDR family oxidoreductase n=1 Tax=Lysinibacillus sp. LZ02 TaxID=3420668 RepID=UPI003D35E25B